MLPKVIPLLSAVVVLFLMAIFLLTSLPLLVLKHDTPLDSRFIRTAFNTYYIGVISAAAASTLSFALAGLAAFSAGMGCVAVFDIAVRRWLIARMDDSRRAMTAGDPAAVSTFQRLHITAIVLNAVQLGPVAWAMTRLAV